MLVIWIKIRRDKQLGVHPLLSAMRELLRSPCALGFLSDAGVATAADKWLVPVMILLLAALNNVAHE